SVVVVSKLWLLCILPKIVVTICRRLLRMVSATNRGDRQSRTPVFIEGGHSDRWKCLGILSNLFCIYALTKYSSRYHQSNYQHYRKDFHRTSSSVITARGDKQRSEIS